MMKKMGICNKNVDTSLLQGQSFFALSIARGQYGNMGDNP